MLNALTLPALAVLIAFPGFGFKKPVAPALGDTLPLPWRSASRLALERRFVGPELRPLRSPGRPGVLLRYDPRKLRVGFDPDSSEVRALTEFGEVSLGEGARIPLREYARDMKRASFERVWRERSRSQINTIGAAGTQQRQSGLSFQLPSPLPRRVQSWLGPGGPAINVSGSENIRLSGTSNWSNQQIGLLGQKQSMFPSLDMQQDLDIRLEGQLSDRIKVNLLQNSAYQIPLANRIAINYRGDDEDVVQALDLGNTNLSLPGTQYVSYSGKNEGLFGAKLSTRVGALDFTVLASKQEGRSERASYGGGASHEQRTLFDADYLKGVYFLLYDPNLETLDIPDSSIRVYVDDAIFTNDGTGTKKGRAYVDPRQRPGFPADTAYSPGMFAISNREDFEILQVYGPYFKVLRMRQALVGEQRLAVTFAARRAGSTGPYDIVVGGTSETDSSLVLKLLRAPISALGKDPLTGLFDTARSLDRVRDLELRNFYQLPGSRIDPKTFQLSIRRDVTMPPVTALRRGSESIPYVELLGLDNLDETSGTPASGHDGAVDGTALKDDQSAPYNVFVDYENGVLFFPDPRPFAPRITGADTSSFEMRVSRALLRRAALVGPRDSLDGANALIYDKYTMERNQDALYFIDVDFTAAKAGGEIQLGRGNIMEGSDVVTINGQPLVRDRDYVIDYDLGRVTMKKQVGAADNLNIDYSYAPLFQQAGRTLLGSAFRIEGRERSLGGAFLYESRGAQDLRPRLGEEPSRSLIGDLNTQWTLHPSWVTRLADRLPGVRTTAPSDLNVQAEGGMSFPNPNTRNEVFIDDMEGIRDAVSLALSPERWRHGSVPSRVENGNVTRLTSPSLSYILNAEVHWYTPPTGIKEKHLKPNLTDAQGANNNRQALAISVPRRPTGARGPEQSPTDSLWVSLTYPLDPVGLDLTRSQFIELWVNDFSDLHTGVGAPRVRGRHVRLHVDIGQVSEDQMRSPDEPPNSVLDTEDRNLDGQLSAVDNDNEDTGYDGKLSQRNSKSGNDVIERLPARTLTTAGDVDPEGDDFGTPIESYPNDLDTRRFRYSNGAEGNRRVNPTPDTEDLSLNGILDTKEGYFEYTIDLGNGAKSSEDSTSYLVADIQRDFPGVVTADDGWRRYRIPLDDKRRVEFGDANLALTKHVRVWVEGIVSVDPDPASEPLWNDGKNDVVRPLLVLGGLDIVGSRWQASAVPARLTGKGTTLTLNTVNSVDNADLYVPPFDPGQTRNGAQGVARREQSLALEFTRLDRGDTLEAYKAFSIDENYSRYGKLEWYVTGFDIPGYDPARDTLWYFVRFASDETGRNYYEYRAPVPASSTTGDVRWGRVSVAVTDLSNLKLRDRFPQVDPILYEAAGPGGVRYVVKGRPSFTRLRRISVGLINGSGVTARSWGQGQLWIDEFRATDVAKDVGKAGRFSATGNIANLLQYNGSLNLRDADFLTVGETRGAGSSQNQTNLGGTLQLHRFFEGTGITLPVTYGYASSSSKPRFTAGDDVVRTGALADASETRSSTRSFGTAYARAWGGRSNPLLRYTIGGITASLSRTWSDSRNPSTLSKRMSTSQNVNWDIAPRSAWTFGLPRTKVRLYPLPERLYWHYALQSSQDSTWDRVRGSADSLLLRNSTRGRSAMVTFGGDSRPIDLFHHHFEGVRNLSLNPELLKQGAMLGRINFGRVVHWAQSMDADFTLQRGPWLRPRLSWNSGYGQNNGPELSRDMSVRAVNNSQGARLSWDLPLDRLAKPAVAAPAKRDSGAAPTRRPFRPGSVLGRLGQVSIESSVTKSSNFARLTGTPSLLYVMGISDDPGLEPDGSGRVRAQSGNQQGTSLTRSASMRSRIDIGLGAALSSRAEVSDQQREYNAVRSATTSMRFPDLMVEYGRIPAAIRLDRVLTNARLRTSLSRSRSWDRLGGTLTTASDGWEMRPLLSLNGDFRNGTRLDLTVDRRSTIRQNFQLVQTRQEDLNTTVNFSLNRSYSQGQKVNLLGRTSTVRTSVSLGLSGAYEKSTGQTVRIVKGRSMPPLYPKDEDRISVRGNGSYGFSTNVSGNAALGFLQTHNIQRDIMRRSITVELRAQFTF